MYNYSKRSVNIISLCVSSVVFLIIFFSFQTILANAENEENVEVFERKG